MSKLKLATVFSGIGAIEFALRRLNIEYDVVFACDNGEREVEYNLDEETKKIKELKTVDEKILHIAIWHMSIEGIIGRENNK